MGLLRLKNIEYWSCFFGASLGIFVNLAMTYTNLLDFSIKDKTPILMRMSLPAGMPETQKTMIISEFKHDLEEFEEINNVKTLVGHIGTEASHVSNIFNSEVLFELFRDKQWQSRTDKNMLITELVELPNKYPGASFKVVHGTSHPLVLDKDTYSTNELKFIPNKDLIDEMNINETELNKQFAAYMRLAPNSVKIDRLLSFEFVSISSGQFISFGTLGDFRQIITEHDVNKLPSGHWKQIFNSSLRTKEYTGISIGISLDYMAILGLQPLSNLESKIREGLKSLGKEANVKEVGQMVLKRNENHVIRLRDIAKIERRYLDINEPYVIYWQDRDR